MRPCELRTELRSRRLQLEATVPACVSEVGRQRSLLAQPTTRASRQPRRSARRSAADVDGAEADNEPSPAVEDPVDADVIPAFGDQCQLTLSKLSVLEHTVNYVVELETKLAAAESALYGMHTNRAASSSGASSLSSTPLMRSASIASLPPAGHPAYAPLNDSDGDAAATLLSFASPVDALRPVRWNDELVVPAPL